MGSLTVVPNLVEGFFRIEANWQDVAHQRKCWIYRKVANAADSTRIALRDGDLVWLSNGVAVAFDHEAPLDTPLQYQSVLPLNVNGDFEDGVAEWLDTTNGGTIGVVTQSLDYYVPNTGQASLQLVSNGGAAAKAVSEFIPATAGTVYTLTGRLMVDSFWTGGIRLQIQWFNGTTPLSNTQGADDFSAYPGNWGSYSALGAAPATTTQCKIAAVITGTPPPTMRLFADELYLTVAASTITGAPVVMPSNGGGWWTDPLHPWSKVRLQLDLDDPDLCGASSGIVYLGMSDETFPADSALLEVNDAPNAVGTWNQRKSGRQTVRVATQTPADIAAVKALHAPGAPLLFQVDQRYGEPEHYGLHGELAVGRIHGEQAVPWRVAQASFGKLAAPVGPAQGTLRSRYADITRFDTFADAMANGGGAYDTFTRTLGAGFWGSTQATATSPALPYTLSSPADMSVNGVTGLAAMPAINAVRRATLAGLSIANFDILLTMSISAGPTGAGGQAEGGIRARFIDLNNFVDCRAFRNVNTNNITVVMRQVVGGVESALTAFVPITGATVGSTITLRFTGVGTALQGWGWPVGTVQPVAPLVTTTVTPVAAGAVEVYISINASVTNAPLTGGFDNLQVTNLATNGGATWLDVLQGEASLQ